MDALTRDPTSLRSPSRTRRLGMAMLCLLMLAGIGYTIWLWPARHPAADAAAAHEAVPVVVADAVARDVPIYRDGLGTVQAFNTVTVKTMVDGPLVAVNFREGQDVRVGQVLAKIDPRTYQAALDQAVAKQEQDAAQLANARIDLARYQKLVANAYTSAQQADTAKAQVAQLAAQVAQDQAQIDNARAELSYTTITAPIDGRIGMRQVDAGNIVHATDAAGLVVITTLQPISVVFTLPQQALPAVAAAMARGDAEVLAYGETDEGGATDLLDRGTLSVLDNQVDQATGTIKLKATFPNAAGKLWPGGFVRVRLRVATARDATVVPPAAVQRGPEGAFAYVVGGDGIARRHALTVGHEDADGSIVLAGVAPGDRVVTDGESRLTEGAHVAVVPGAAAPPAIDAAAAPGTQRTP